MAEVYRIEIDVDVRDNTSPELEKAQARVTKFEKAMQKTEERLRKLRSERWDLRLQAVDATGNVLGSIRNRLLSLTGRTWRISIGIASAPFRALSMISNTMRSLGLIGVAGGIWGTKELFESTIGASAQMEMARVQIGALFRDVKRTEEYMRRMSDLAIKSPVLGEMGIFQNSKSFIALTKNVDQLERMWKLAELLAAMDPLEGVEGAVFALRELFSGDAVSIVERFEMPRDVMNEIKNLSTLNEKIVALEKYFKQMGFDQEYLNRISKTSIGIWTQIGEKVRKAFRLMGEDGLDKIRPRLEKLNKFLESDAMRTLVEFGSDMIGGFVQTTIEGFDRVKSYIQRHFLNNPAFLRLNNLGDRLKFVFNETFSTINKWLEGKGAEKIRQIGRAIGGGLSAGLSGIFGGVADPNSSPFIKAGVTAGKEFSEAFKENFDANAVAQKLVEAFRNIQPTWLGGKATGAAQIPALAIDAWLLAQLFGIIGGALTIGGAAFKGIRGIRDWFRRRREINEEIRDLRRRDDDDDFPRGSAEPPRTRRGRILRGLGRFARLFERIPGLNVVFDAFDIINSRSPKKRGEAWGGSIGGLIGGSIGWSIGGLPGSLIGGTLGDIIGSKIGGAIGKLASKVDWGKLISTFTSKFTSIGVMVGQAMARGFNSVKDRFVAVINWIRNQVASVLDWASSKVSSLFSWTGEKASAVLSWLQTLISQKHAHGGFFSSPHIGMVAERGPEAIIPLSSSFRHRGLDLWARAGQMLGVSPAPAYSGIPVHVPSSRSVTLVVQASPQYNISAAANASDILRVIRENQDDLADDFADSLAHKLEGVFSNM